MIKEEITFRGGGGGSVWGGSGRAVGGGKPRNQLSGGFQRCGWLPPPHLHPIGSPTLPLVLECAARSATLQFEDGWWMGWCRLCDLALCLSGVQCGVSLSHLLGADHGSTTSTAGGLVLRPSSCIFGKMHAYHRERWSSLFGIGCTSAPDDHSCVGSSALRVCVSWRWCWCLHPVCSVCALVLCTMFEGPPLAVLCGQGAKSCTLSVTTF